MNAEHEKSTDSGHTEGGQFREKIEQIRSHFDIRYVVGLTTAVNDSNMAICPFHNDNQPSLSVNSPGQYFHCFGCGVGGDVFRFLELVEGQSFRWVLGELAEIAGVSINEGSGEDLKNAERERRIEAIRAAAVTFYTINLTEAVQEYLNARGITDESIERFRIGWSAPGLLKYLLGDCGFDDQECVDAGVLSISKRTGRAFPFFRERIVIPTLWRGRVVSLTGRRLDGGPPKYLKIRGTSTHLFNEDDLGGDAVVVVEGIFDAIAVTQTGVRVVSPVGTHIKKEILGRLDRCPKVYLAFDPDEAGRRATRTLCEHLRDRARVIEFPGGLDPDEFIQKEGANAFEVLADAAPDGIEWQVNQISETTLPIGVPDALRPILQQLAKLEEAKAEAYLKTVIGRRFNLRKEDLAGHRKMINGFRQAKKREKASAGKPDGRKAASPAEDSRYSVVEGAIAVRRGEGDDVFYDPVANFDARIIGEERHDDGAEVSTIFTVEGSLQNGKTLPQIRVAGSIFNTMKWVTESWGAGPVVMAGPWARDHVRTAVQLLSGEVPQRTIFGHSGFRRIDGEWLYLHAGGGIGAGGNRPDVQVSFSAGRLADFLLPEPPEGGARISAVRASLSIAELADRAVGVSLLAATYRAPLVEVLPADLAVFLFGPTGSQKSELTAIVQSHYGARFSRENLPGNFQSTANQTEKAAFLMKDAIFAVDDLAPTGTLYEIQKTLATAERLFRSQGNRSGRWRMRPDGSLAPAYYPRGIILSNGEDLPRGQSARARAFILNVRPGSVDLSRLTLAQHHAREGTFAASMAAYVGWLASRIDGLRGSIPARREELRDELRRVLVGHDRAPDAVANLLLGLESFVDFAREAGAVDAAEAGSMLTEGRGALLDAAREQANFQKSEDPVTQFLHLLTSLLSAGRAHIVLCDSRGKTTGCEQPWPADAWGWRAEDDFRWAPQGDRIGWMNFVDLFLEPGAAFAAAQKLAREQGTGLPISESTLWRRMKDRHLLASTDSDHNTTKYEIDGSRRRVIHVLATLIVPECGVNGAPGAEAPEERSLRKIVGVHTQ